MRANRCAALVLLLLAIITSIHSKAQNLNLNISAQAGYDNTIITSLVDSNGNPLFLSGSGTSTLTISGNTTPLVSMIAGVYQQLTTSVGLGVSNSSGFPQLQFVYALQDLSPAEPAELQRAADCHQGQRTSLGAKAGYGSDSMKSGQ